MDMPGPGEINIDEGLLEWFEEGYQSLVAYLAKWALLDAWCAEHDRREPIRRVAPSTLGEP